MDLLGDVSGTIVLTCIFETRELLSVDFNSAVSDLLGAILQ
jgi:hypothetical protein